MMVAFLFSSLCVLAECIFIGFASSMCSRLGVVEALHHTGVAVKSGLMLNHKRFVNSVIYFTTLFFLAECNIWSFVASTSLRLAPVEALHHAGVAVRMNLLEVKMEEIQNTNFVLVAGMLQLDERIVRRLCSDLTEPFMLSTEPVWK